MSIWARLWTLYLSPGRWLNRSLAEDRATALAGRCKCGEPKAEGELRCEECKAW
jgi:hypothetical protein